jgi:hypothetical protein
MFRKFHVAILIHFTIFIGLEVPPVLMLCTNVQNDMIDSTIPAQESMSAVKMS